MNDDDWDRVVSIEETIINQGINEGIADAEKSEAHDEGYQVGYDKGLAIGIEIGFYETAVDKILQSSTIDMNSKLFKRCYVLKQKIISIPQENDNFFDFEKVISECRSLFKLIEKEMSTGAFPPLKGRIESTDW